MHIRKAEISDALEIQKLVSSLSHFYLENKNASLPKWFAETLELSEFEERLSNIEFTNFVFTDNDEIIGYISIKDKTHIYHLFVAEKYQGKGISKKLWKFVKSKQVTNFYTVRSSIFAIPVYQSFGFKVHEPQSSKDGISFQLMKLTIPQK